MGIQWSTVIVAALFGAFFGPWVLVKFTGKTGASSNGGY